MSTVLKRMGNKSKLAHKIYSYFPPHQTYIEPFFGAGGLFFNRPPAKRNIVNDLDKKVYNLFKILQKKETKKELIEALKIAPFEESFFKDRSVQPSNIWSAVHFLLVSNGGLFGADKTLRVDIGNVPKDLIYKAVCRFSMPSNTIILNKKWKPFLNSIHFKPGDKNNAFIYCDPPYLGTGNNYVRGFKEEDTEELFKCLTSFGVRAAISEFNTPEVVKIASKYGWYIHQIGERRNINNTRTEVLFTNYKTHKSLFD